MVKAFVLVEMVAGQSTKLVNTLSERSEFVNVARVTGPYDMIAVVEADDINKISDVVTTQIHSLQGVVKTTTCVSLE